ncbi:hypothetical protein MG293_007266 [Ovis ammon polii]|uniref:Aminopeptidase n=1 Tax=Ovis ammon polii TaxID=230172 RepID=A0AAD4UGE2_OVIAM|nr:hypothetical protein MG293_007266 [Ovis ammon polii]
MFLEEGSSWEGSKRYCIKKKHVAIICAVVVAVGLIVGLSVGLTRSCDSTESGQGTTQAPSHLPPVTSPPQDQGVCPASEDESGGWKDFRLPDFIKPVHYDLEVKPLMEEDTYTGSVDISINVTSLTRYLWLHLRETRITKLPVLRRPSGEQVQVRQCFEYKKQEYVVVEAEEELVPSAGQGLYHLILEFAGWLNGSLVGFYRTTYVEKGQTNVRLLGNWVLTGEERGKDELKGHTLTGSEYNAVRILGMEQKEESVDDKWNRTTFQKSVPMSTYLVCFAVHQFDSVTRISNRGIPLTIYVQPEQKHTAEYAANITKTVFDYFEDYFAMNYSLPKLDKIAIPDFGTGAMENWGLITYRETNLLYDPDESASSNKQRVAAVIAHELVHQWFGNIVTMEWWEDLWLNEGFASFFEYLGVDHAEKDWQMRDQIILDDVLPVQEDDSLISSHPIVVTVTTPDEITSVFDGISYSKNYLRKHKFENAKTSDFWAALEEASNLPVKEVMDTWTNQMGYPVLNVNNMKNITQKRFLLDSRANSSEPHSAFGDIFNSQLRAQMTTRPVGITLGSTLSGNAFLKINPDHIGFYRVNYEVSTWEWIATNLSINHTDFSSADRASFIDDAFALARAQLLTYKEALNLTKYLKEEKEYLPWQRVISAVTYIISMFEDDKELYPVIENSGNETSWNYTLEQYQKTSLAQEKEKLLYGLASVKNVTLLSRYLDLLKDSNLIKTQDVFTVIQYISYNSYGKTMAWNWIQLNWEYLVNRYTLNNRNLGRIVTIAEPFNTELQLWQTLGTKQSHHSTVQVFQETPWENVQKTEEPAEAERACPPPLRSSPSPVQQGLFCRTCCQASKAMGSDYRSERSRAFSKDILKLERDKNLGSKYWKQ